MVDKNPAAHGGLISKQRVQNRGLAAAAFARQHDELMRRRGKAQILQLLVLAARDRHMVKFDRGRVMQRIRGGRGRCRRLQFEHSGERGVGLENIVAVPADRSSGRQDIGHIGVRDGDAARSRGPGQRRTGGEDDRRQISDGHQRVGNAPVDIKNPLALSVQGIHLMREGMEARRLKTLASPCLDNGNTVQKVADRAHEPAAGGALLGRNFLAFDRHALAGSIQRQHQRQRDRTKNRAPDEHHDDRADHFEHHRQQPVQRARHGADDGFHVPGDPGNDVALPPFLLIRLVGLQRPRHGVVAQRFDDPGRQHGIRMTICEADRMLRRVHNAEEHKVQREAGPQNEGEDAAAGGEKIDHRCDDLDGEQTQPRVDHRQAEDQQDRGPFRFQVREQSSDSI